MTPNTNLYFGYTEGEVVVACGVGFVLVCVLVGVLFMLLDFIRKERSLHYQAKAAELQVHIAELQLKEREVEAR